MNSRATWRWLLVAAVLSIAVFVHHRFFRKTPVAAIKILPNLKPAAVSSVQVQLGQLEIRADRTNGGWVLTRPISYPAEALSIEMLLKKLKDLSPAASIDAAELKSHSKADEEFGFASPFAAVLIEQETNRVHLLLGGRTAPGDQIYLQVVGVDSIYVVDINLLKLIPRSGDDWRDASFLDLRSLAFNRIAITNNGKLFITLERDPANELWRMVNPSVLRADATKIGQALENLKPLRVSRFVSDDPKSDLEGFGLQPPDLELAFSQGTNLVLLQFGKTNETNQVFARRYGQSTIVTVPSEFIAPWRTPVNDFRDPYLVALTRPIESIEVRGQESFSVRRQENGAWQVLPQNFAADAGLMKDFLAALTTVRIEFVQDVVTEAGLPAYGLSSPSCRYLLQAKPDNAAAASNSVIAELVIGSQKLNRVYVRRADENSVYAISTNDFARFPAASWQLRDRRLWSFNDEDIAGATIRKDGKACQIVRKERFKWSIAVGSQGIIKDEIPLEETMRGLAQVKAAAWVGRGAQERARYGLTDASLQVTLDLKNGEKATVQFGSEASPVTVYAGVTLEGEFWIIEFPWLLFRDVINYLPVS